MADPIREQILQRVKTQLETITTVNGFQQDIEAVFRSREAVLNVDERPALLMVDRGDVKKRHIRLAYENRIQLEILAYTREHDDDERNLELSRLHADVEKLVAADEKWNNLAARTFMSALAVSQGEATEPHATTLTTLEILYRVEEKDPFTIRAI